jgi:hypothetical protein
VPVLKCVFCFLIQRIVLVDNSGLGKIRYPAVLSSNNGSCIRVDLSCDDLEESGFPLPFAPARAARLPFSRDRFASSKSTLPQRKGIHWKPGPRT